MPITILVYVKSQLGEQDSYSAEDFYDTGVDIMGGCEICAATITGYNAYPSTSGYWRCADCIGATGFATVDDFINAGNTTSEGQESTGGDTATSGDCGPAWAP